MGEISTLPWLIGLVKHVIWGDSSYFLYLLLLSLSKILIIVQTEPRRANDNRKTGHSRVKYNITHKMVPPWSLELL
jgi:hypothetical protein